MTPCPNCGHRNYIGLFPCGCTWSEQIQAAKIIEKRKRRTGVKQVLVNHLSNINISGILRRNSLSNND